MSSVNTLAGIWTDYGLANQINAQMELEDRTLSITLDDGRSFEFPRSLVQLSAPVIGGRRVLRVGKLGQIEVTNDRQLDEIFPIQSTSLLSRLEKLERRAWIAWAGAVLLPITLAAGFHFGVPMLARGLASTMPQTTNDRLSNEVLARLQGSGKFKSSTIDPYRQREIEYKLKHILDDRPIAKFIQVKFYDAGALATAMALPNGTVVVTDRLVYAADNDSQILAVLGHEVGHVQNRHQVRQSMSQAGLSGMLALVSGAAASQLVSASMVGQMANLSYSRDMETEADRYSFKLLRESQISPIAFVRAMENIQGVQSSASIRSLSVHFMKEGPYNVKREQSVLVLRMEDENKEMRIVHDGGNWYALQGELEDIPFQLRPGDKFRVDQPFPVEITRNKTVVGDSSGGYFSSHPATAARIGQARKEAAEFEKTGR